MSLDAKLDACPWTWWLAAAWAQFCHLGRMILVAGSCGKANLVCLVAMIDGACAETMVSKGWSGSGRFCCKSYNNFLISAPAHPPSCVVYAINHAHSNSQLLQLLWCCCIIVHQRKNPPGCSQVHASICGVWTAWTVDTESLLSCREMIILHVCSFNTDAAKKKKQWKKMAQWDCLAQISLKHLHFMNVSVYLNTLKVCHFTKNLLATHGNPVKINNLGSLLQINLI